MKNALLRRLCLTFALLGVMMGGFALPARAALIFDKIRFAADVGVAYYCFHHWVSNPYRDGKFSKGAPHRTGTIVKAGVALLFAVNRINAASTLAHKSKDPILHKLAGALDSMGSAFSSVGARFKSGQAGPGDATALKSAFGAFDSGAKANGLAIKDTAVPVPGL